MEQNKHHGDYCLVCGGEASGEFNLSWNVKYCTHVCRICFLIELAILEAKDESRRFVSVSVGGKMKSFSGDRCACGRCALGAGVIFSKGKKTWREYICQVCAINNRMLSKAEAQTKLLLAQYRMLLKQVKENKDVA